MNRKPQLLNIVGSILITIQILKYFYWHFEVPSRENTHTYFFEYAGYIVGYNIFLLFSIILFRVANKSSR